MTAADNTVVPGIASVAYVYGLVIPGRLTGANAWSGPITYLLGIACLWIGFSRPPRPAPAGSRGDLRCSP